MADKPKSVLFVCTFNAIRSPMAEGLLRQQSGGAIEVASAGVHTQLTDGFAIRVMRDIGIDMANHEGQTLEDVSLPEYDLIVTLSEPAPVSYTHLTLPTIYSV